jgi:hypothetical protein
MPSSILTRDLLKPVLTRVDQFDLSQCSCQITNLDSVEFDLSTPAVQYSGGHISVDIHAPCSPDPLQTTDSQDSLSIEEVSSRTDVMIPMPYWLGEECSYGNQTMFVQFKVSGSPINSLLMCLWCSHQVTPGCRQTANDQFTQP